MLTIILFCLILCFFLKLLQLYNSFSVFLHEVWCTSVSHLFPFSWKILWTLTLLFSLIFLKLLRALLTHMVFVLIVVGHHQTVITLFSGPFFFFPLWARFVSEDYLSLHFFEHILSPVTLASEQCEGGLIIYSSMKNCLPVVGVFSNFMYFSS